MNSRFLAIAGLALLAVLVAAPAVHADAIVLATAEDEVAETEGDESVEPSGAAVEAPGAAEDDSDPPWTFRYLVPTLLALTALVVLASVAYYIFRVKARYRIVS